MYNGINSISAKNSFNKLKYRYHYKTNTISLSLFFVMFCASLFVLFTFPDKMDLLPVLSVISSFIIGFLLIPEYYRSRSYTVLFFTVSAILKYVLQPLIFCISPIYTISSYTAYKAESIEIGILLIIIELVFVSITVVCFSRRFANKRSFFENICISDYLRSDVYSRENHIVIVFFVIVALSVLFLYPDSLNTISFMIISANTGIRMSSTETTTFNNLLRQIVIIGIYSTFVLIACWCYKKYIKYRNKTYVFIAVIFALMTTMVIIGEARSSQIYSGFAAYALLSGLFPEYKKPISKMLLLFIVIVITLLSIYKFFYAFQYSSYYDALMSSNYQFDSLTLNFDLYFGGPISYAAAVDLNETAIEFGIERFLFGFFRSTMGPNLLVREVGIDTTGMVYNLFLTGGRANTGYLLPITGLGYLYFGILLSPIITCIVYRIAFYLESKILFCKSPFLIFFISYCYIRLATCIIFTNINTILTLTSMTVLTAGVLYFINLLVDRTIKRLIY